MKKHLTPALLVFAIVWAVAATAYWFLLGWNLGLPEVTLPGAGWAFPAHVVQPFFAAGVVLFCAAAWGDLFWIYLRLGNLDSPPDSGNCSTDHLALDLFLERIVGTMLVGLFVQGLAIFLLGIVGFYPWGLAVILIPLLRPAFWRSLRGGVESIKWLKLPTEPLGFCLLVLLAVGGLTMVLAALGPAIESDGLRYHLFGPQEYLKAGGIVPVVGVSLTNLPFLTQMQYIPALLMGGNLGSAPQVLHASYWWLLLGSAYLFTREVQFAFYSGTNEAKPPRVIHAVLVAVLATTLPVSMVIASWPFIDLSTAAFGVYSLVLLVRGMQANAFALPGLQNQWALLLGLIAGAAIATKPTALVPGFFTGLIVLSLAIRWRRLFPVLIYGLAVLAVPAPWFIKSAVYQGNPLYPAAYSVLGGADWDEDTDAFYKEKSAEKGFVVNAVNLVASPFDVTARWSTNFQSAPDGTSTREDFKSLHLSGRFFRAASPGFEDHNPGPAFLSLLPLALIGLLLLALKPRHRGMAVVIVVHGVMGWCAWFITYQSVRFLIIPLMLGIILGGVTGLRLAQQMGVRGVSKIAELALVILCTVQLAWPVQYQLSTVPGRSARGLPVYTSLGFQHPETVLATNFSLYTVFKTIARDLEPNPTERVLLMGNYKGFHADFPIITSDFFDRPLILTWIRETPSTQDLLAYLQEKQNIRYILYDLGELRLYSALYFQPRFTEQEWARFSEFQERLLANPKALVYQEPRGIYLVDINVLLDS
ncbi:MAG: hypothetical protein ACFCU1_04710 [Sumerlaeia bacterium]